MTKKRELLKALSVASVAGTVWKKPSVNSVLLPVHAATSCGTIVCSPTALLDDTLPATAYANLTPCISCGLSDEEQSNSALRITGIDGAPHPSVYVLIELLNGFSHEDSLTTTGIGQQTEGQHSIPLKAPDGSIWRVEFKSESGSLNIVDMIMQLLDPGSLGDF